MTKTVKVQISDDLITSAEEYLARRPSTVAEQIEAWAYLGQAASRHLTEHEVMKVMLGDGEIRVLPKHEQ